MVNTGKPSGACVTCKNRRIKCDEARPHCTRCLSTNRNCLGYPKRELFEIKNETILVQQKAAQVSKKNRKKLNVGSSRHVNTLNALTNTSLQHLTTLQKVPKGGKPFESVFAESHLPSASLLSENLGVPVHDVAISYFFHRYTPAPGKHNVPGLFLSNLVDMYAHTVPASPLYHATHSLALTVLANLTRQQWIRQKALASYGESLHALSTAISDKEYAKDDSVITASLLICMFEDQTHSTFSVENYRSHLMGLALLIRNRGTDQFRNSCSLSLFRAVRHQVLLQAIQTSEPLHPFWTSDRNTTSQNFLEASGAHLDRVAAHIPALQARVNQFYAEPVEDAEVLAMLHRTYDLDARIVECYRNLLKFYFPHDFHCLDGASLDEIPDSPIDPDTSNYLVHTRYYNNFRMYRIHFQSLIIRCLMHLNSPAQLERDHRYISAIGLSRRLANEICSNVSVFFDSDYVKTRRYNGVTEGVNQGTIADGTLGMFCQIWPMFIVHALEIIPREQKLWIEEKLDLAAETFGFQHAKALKLVKPYLLLGQLYR